MKKKYLAQRLEAIHSMPNYLRVLTILTGKKISRDDLIDLESSINLLEQMQPIRALPAKKYVIEFAQKNSSEFSKFINTLSKAKNIPVYLWSEGASVCGVYKTHSLQDINFNFEYEIDGNGVFVFTSSDLQDELLLDFYETPNGTRMLKVETFGETWSAVDF